MVKLSKIAVVIPAYKVADQILDVVSQISHEVSLIIVVDDKCPEDSGQKVVKNCKDPRVKVLFHPINKGVGGAMVTGYRYALEQNVQVIVKIDGDGQMDPSHIKNLVYPVLNYESDYVKGNRFYDIEAIRKMPKVRLVGNLILSFLSKISTGYWQIFDPNNGLTAINAEVLRKIPLHKLSNGYFFESDMLFRLNLLRAKVTDMPMEALYADEKSSLSVSKSIFEFSYKHAKNFLKRIVYCYYLREFTLASIELPTGFSLFSFGSIYGIYNWINSANLNQATPTGTLVLIALTTLSGIQLILSFTAYDMQMAPKVAISKLTQSGS
jgi:dolichol-phosphate mannosyltransferase